MINKTSLPNYHTRDRNVRINRKINKAVIAIAHKEI